MAIPSGNATRQAKARPIGAQAVVPARTGRTKARGRREGRQRRQALRGKRREHMRRLFTLPLVAVVALVAAGVGNAGREQQDAADARACGASEELLPFASARSRRGNAHTLTCSQIEPIP